MTLKCYLFSILACLFMTVNAQEKKELKAGDKSPAFTYLDINGNEVSLKDFKGKYVLIDFWNTMCGPCRRELPLFKELEKKMQGKKIVFVTVSSDRDRARWEKMVKEQGLSGMQLHNGGDRSFMQAYGFEKVPRFILLDKKGRIVNPDMTRPSDPETEKTLKALKGI